MAGNFLEGPPEDDDQSFEDTLIREADEEADVEVDRNSLVPEGYVKISLLHKDNKEVTYSLRFSGRIKNINKQTIDIATGKINHRKFIIPKDFLEYICNWGNFGEWQRDKVLKFWQSGKVQASRK